MNVSRATAVHIASAIAIGLLGGGVSFATFSFVQGSDFRAFHFAADVWLSGGNAYAVGLPVRRLTRVVPEPFYYPFPTLLAMAPFALLPLRIAAAAFVATSSSLLAYGVLARSPQRLPLFFGAGFLVAAIMGQWAPLITATLLLPGIAWLAVLKPNIGLAATIARPTRSAILGGAILLLSTLAFQPTWPIEWIRNLRSMPPHPAPVFVPGGALVLLALLRWRRPEARLLVAMACVPQLMYFADQLPLWLVAKTRRESLLLSATSLVAWAAALISTTRAGLQPALSSTWFVLAGVYLPALIMVLRRPNEGSRPAWISARREAGERVDGEQVAWS